ncbi:DUF4445 domain-containing protein [Oryzomonas sagensis]|uniref:DUF4445 domain-containing protein n=1 Tax=Oryzomonas sagensis TaxID=2603857 RepID=A0ABQ6TNH9_9BACT|nr:ASKHA domain-containing protein [Oryzomonas sagensis]KAB0670186.1 DUF4445 domain-containing protein [Oryzomonas sagensis]
MPGYALAMDLGTTTLAASLMDRATGQRLAMTGGMNPQRRFGADVVSRLAAAVHSEEALQEMARLIRTELLRLAHDLCAESCVPWGEVKQVAIAGNPAMQHLLLKLPVKTLAFPPYRPLFTGGKRVTAGELEWDGAAPVYLFPMPGGFVGGDTVAFLYGARPGEAALCLDMGTNGEMALTAGATIWATSAAAGPAFEGGNLSCGMAALPGAITSIRIEGERVKIATLGNREPVGICGSAAIELVTELLACGVLEAGGRLRTSAEIPSNLGQRVIEQEGESAFVIHRDARGLLLLTQRDIRQIQLAKGAIRAGMEVLAERSGIPFPGLKEVLLTGSFGAVLRPLWLKTIGIFDAGMVQISQFTPEGALAGVERALAEHDDFASVERLGMRFRVVPLSGTPLFETMFMKHMDFPQP